jgi:hypothetical protein
MTQELRRLVILAVAAVCVTRTAALQAQRFEISYGSAVHQGPLTGRLILILSKNQTPEPRFAIGPQGPAMLAVDIEQLAPDRTAIIDDTAIGYPARLSALPPGDYFAQAIVNVYEQARRSDGPTIWVKLNDGSQEFFNNAVGNIYSDVQPVRIGSTGTIRITLNKKIGPRPKPNDTEWVKRVSIQSKKLTAFWGRPIYVNATVLLPKGYSASPNVRYPAVYTLGHTVPFSFNPDSSRVQNIGVINRVTGLETGFDFYKSWISDGFPRVIAIAFQQQTPYFPDSYSVNSANNGPYGDAITEEVIPELERQFRIIAKPYARLVEGASTGGWQTLALQLKHPDYFGGAWILQPDPIDFRRYQFTNIYQDTNAFVIPAGQFITAERPFRRSLEGQPVWSVRQLSLFEAVLGSKGRSGYQLGAWEAVYGPVGPDGYPKPLWDKLTGKIDREVANYMRENGFDLREYAQRNWATLGPKIVGKLHFFTGDMDDFYLNLAVYQFEEFLKGTTNPHYPAEFTYGRPTKGHSWHAFTWAEMVRRMAEHVKKNAPPGEDTRAWNY